MLDLPLGLAMAAFTLTLVWLGEGRRPALADNLFQILVAPIFLCAEIFFALGYKPRLHRGVQERAQRLRAGG